MWMYRVRCIRLRLNFSRLVVGFFLVASQNYVEVVDRIGCREFQLLMCLVLGLECVHFERANYSITSRHFICHVFWFVLRICGS